MFLSVVVRVSLIELSTLLITTRFSHSNTIVTSRKLLDGTNTAILPLSQTRYLILPVPFTFASTILYLAKIQRNMYREKTIKTTFFFWLLFTCSNRFLPFWLSIEINNSMKLYYLSFSIFDTTMYAFQYIGD